MRVAINLASEPFRRDRPLVAAFVAVGVMLVGLLGMLIYLAVGRAGPRGRSARGNRQNRNPVEDMQRERASPFEGVLRQQQNADVLDRSVFLNDLLTRKGVSWTRIFSDLEKVTPHNVRLITVRPQINANNDLSLDMVVGSQSAESILNFVMQLEASSVFGKTTVPHTLAAVANRTAVP